MLAHPLGEGFNLLDRYAADSAGPRRRFGGEVRFECRVDGLELNPVDRSIQGLQLDSGERIAATQVVLALGHSARDSFEMLKTAGVAMQPKPFAAGLRIEHPQSLIDRARWGQAAGHPRLGPAEYKLVHHCRETANLGRSVYSFCMCPGGLVVGATSEPGRVVTNGMSQHTRNERNANSGIVVGIELADLTPYGERDDDPLAGVAFQRYWEGRAFVTGGSNYQAPAQRVGDFLANRSSEGSGGVIPSYQPGVCYGNLAGCLPEFVLTAIREALPAFDRRIPGFLMGDALLTGVETRTSSPGARPSTPSRGMSTKRWSLNPTTSRWRSAAAQTNPRITALSPAQSPPAVRMPRREAGMTVRESSAC
jgi:uncharacterized FAD-dependent dehydrogenase